MGRRVECAGCGQVVEIERVSTMSITLQAPVSGGIPPLPVKANVDLCSGHCVAAYLAEGALNDLKLHVGRIAAVGAYVAPAPPPRKRDEDEAVIETEPHLLPSITVDGSDRKE
jgi:hypothetical protein